MKILLGINNNNNYNTRGGCEAAVDACCRYLNSLPEDHVIVKLDFSNAFNCLRRETLLKAVYAFSA